MSKVTVEFGTKTVELTAALGNTWEKNGIQRNYIDVVSSNKKCPVITGLYEAVSGGVGRDTELVVNGKVYGVSLHIDANSKTKRAAAIEAAEALVNGL